MYRKGFLELIKKGPLYWNKWRGDNPQIIPDLRGIEIPDFDFSEFNLSKVNFSEANLRRADFSMADLRQATFTGANLNNGYFYGVNSTSANFSGADMVDSLMVEGIFEKADFTYAHLYGSDCTEAIFTQAKFNSALLVNTNLSYTDLTGACLTDADLSWANLSNANFKNAKLNGCVIENAQLIETNFENADISNSYIFGVSAWDLKMNKFTKQSNLVITKRHSEQPVITVDNMKVAQFIYLILNNQEIRDVIDTLTSKAVLILGRFTEQRKVILEIIRVELRKRNYLPIMFDFEKPLTRDTTETVTTLARLSRFVIADITTPRSIPQELITIIESMPSLPVKPLLEKGSEPWGMYDHIKKYPWVLNIFTYESGEEIINSFDKEIEEIEKILKRI